MFLKWIMIFVFLFSMAVIANDKFEINPETSTLVYLAKKVTGQHAGAVKIKTGFLIFEKDLLKGGEFEIDMATITNTDIADQEYRKKFITHLNSDDFFSVEKFKTAKLVLKTITINKDNSYNIIGDLTIKGKTAPITFTATATKDKALAKVVFDRTVYDVKYGSGKFFQNLGDKMINDDVQLDVSLSFKK